jgi:predicted NBD/HSP70 family sugar kinase
MSEFHGGLSGSQPRQARQANTAAVLQLLAQRGPSSRGDLAVELSLNHGSVSRIVEPLLQAGLVREVTEQPRGRGRPRVPLEINPTSRFAVGVHLGVQHTTVGLTNLAGHCVEKFRENRDPSDAVATVRRAAELSREMAATASGPVLGVGVITGGRVDRERGQLVRNEVLGWDHVQLADLVGERSGLRVIVDNTVRAQLGAELAFGGSLGYRNVMYLFVGNVVEVGFVSRQVANSPHDIIQGDVSRILVRDLNGDGIGRFGTCGSDQALLAAANERGLSVRSVAELAIRADHHDLTAINLLNARAVQVAQVLDVLCDVMRPELVILGGGAAPSERWLHAVQSTVSTIAPDRVVRSAPPENALVIAAGGLLIRSFLAAGITEDIDNIN